MNYQSSQIAFNQEDIISMEEKRWLKARSLISKIFLEIGYEVYAKQCFTYNLETLKAFVAILLYQDRFYPNLNIAKRIWEAGLDEAFLPQDNKEVKS